MTVITMRNYVRVEKEDLCRQMNCSGVLFRQLYLWLS